MLKFLTFLDFFYNKFYFTMYFLRINNVKNQNVKILSKMCKNDLKIL